jgi:hypothetical protein
MFVFALLLCMLEVINGRVAHYEPLTNVVFSNHDSRPAHKRVYRHTNHEQPFPDTVNLQFSAFGHNHDYNMKVHSVFADDAVITVYKADNVKTRHSPRIRTYRQETEDGWVTLTFHGDGGFQGAVYSRERGLMHVERLRQHSHDMHPKRLRTLEDATSGHGVIAFMDEAIDRTADTCGVASVDRNQTRKVHLEPAHGGRHLLAVDYWDNCFVEQANGRQKIFQGIAADVHFYEALGSSTTAVQDEMASVIALGNNIYTNQMDVVITIAAFDIMTVSDSSIWNGAVCDQCTDTTCNSRIDNTLDDFTVWRNNNHPHDAALWAHVTNCYPPAGTVGLAWLGVICISTGVGTSSYHSGWWTTLAHETGHNFDASHTFTGDGTPWGIMDYNDGTWLGEYQFYSPGNEAEVCAHIQEALNEQQPLYNLAGASSSRPPYGSCFQNEVVFCGDGYIDDGEECDPGLGEGVDSACCVSCQLTAGSQCASGECCTNDCKFAASDTLCETGYCDGAGVCAGTICPTFGAYICGLSLSLSLSLSRSRSLSLSSLCVYVSFLSLSLFMGNI